MPIAQRWLVITSFLAVTSTCGPQADVRARANPQDAIYVALAERLLQWAGAEQGVFEARPVLAGLDSLEIARHLVHVARAMPTLDPAMLAQIRETAGGVVLAGLTVILLLLELMALFDPAGTKLADDNDPFGPPAPWYVHVVWFGVIALLAALSARLLRSKAPRTLRKP